MFLHLCFKLCVIYLQIPSSVFFLLYIALFGARNGLVCFVLQLVLIFMQEGTLRLFALQSL